MLFPLWIENPPPGVTAKATWLLRRWRGFPHSPMEVWKLVALHRRGNTGDQGTQLSTVDDAAMRRSTPDLFDFLVCDTWGAGEPRERGTILLFTDGEAWKACLNDKAACMVAFVTGSSIAEVLQAANSALGPGKGDWRATKADKARRR